ncbi:MAG: peptide-methionine (R)-S-oxide reductase MsrB [Erythrobacter sp.]
MPNFLASRRTILGALGLSTALPLISACGSSPASAQSFPKTKSDEEWRQILTREEFYVLREEGTERAFTSPLNDEKRAGMFVCAGCENEVYSSAAKYDSRSGWPSFWEPVDSGAVGTSTDFKIGYPRTEVHCADCGGHLGHIFSDGPEPTGKRHCINGVAMDFVPA